MESKNWPGNDLIAVEMILDAVKIDTKTDPLLVRKLANILKMYKDGTIVQHYRKLKT